jgi:KipI family sensor histidine kinase inhibitor
MTPRITALGEGALLMEAPEGPLSLAVQGRIWAIAAAALDWPGVEEAVPAMNNLMLVFDPLADVADGLTDRLVAAWQSGMALPPSARTRAIPVHYGGAQGKDLHAVAQWAGLTVAEVVGIHSSAEYTVFAVGSMPGFVYLGGLDPRLAIPRRTAPRTRVESGAVMIGGGQAGMMPTTAPSGWHILGHSDVQLFDAARQPAALFAAGDRLRFTVADFTP